MSSSYAVVADLVRFGVNASALASVSSSDQQAALDNASALADSYLGARYSLPLTTYGDDIKRAVCNIAAYDLLCVRGFNPAVGADVNYRMRREDAVRWLELVARQQVTPVGIVAGADQVAVYDEPCVTTSTKRGW
jgi:phage gp36-like protein